MSSQQGIVKRTVREDVNWIVLLMLFAVLLAYCCYFGVYLKKQHSLRARYNLKVNIEQLEFFLA